MGAGRDPKTKRFVPGYSDDQLVEVVVALCRRVRAQRPESVTKPEFNSAKAKSEWSDAPDADGIRRRFSDLPWPELLAIAFDPKRDVIKTAEARARRRPTGPPNSDEAAYFLRLAAAAAGDRWAGRPDDYGQVEQLLRDRARRRYRHGTSADTVVPDRYEIENALKTETEGGWDVGLRVAGLPPREPPRGAPPGNSLVVMAGRFYDEVGCMPWSIRALREYAKQKGESLAIWRRGIGVINDQLRNERAALGQRLPAAPPPPGAERPEIAVEPNGPPVRLRRVEWRDDRQAVIEGLALAYDAIWPETQLKQAVHRRLARGNPAIPHPSAVQGCATNPALPPTTAAKLRREAVALSQQRRRGRTAGPETRRT